MSSGTPVKYGKACHVISAVRLNKRKSDHCKPVTNLTLTTMKSKFHFVLKRNMLSPRRTTLSPCSPNSCPELYKRFILLKTCPTFPLCYLRAGRPRDRSSSTGRIKNFLPSTSSRSVLGPTQPPIQWVPGALSPGLKQQGRELTHLQLMPRSRTQHPLPRTSS
jgi:hypothetical protein